MNQVKLRSKLFGIIPLTREVEIPKNWDEVHPSSLLFIAKTLVKYFDDPAKIKVNFLQHFLKVSKRTILKFTEGQLMDLMDLFDFLDLDKLEFQLFPNPAKDWTLPSTNFEDGVCYEFAKADTYFQKYLDTEDPKDLDKFFVCLARHKGQHTTTEQIMNEKLKKLPKISESVKLVTFCYFSAIKRKIHELYKPWLFSTDPSEVQTRTVNFGWFGTFLRVAKAGVFGTIHQVHAYNFYDVLGYLVQEKEDHEQTKAQIKKNQKK